MDLRAAALPHHSLFHFPSHSQGPAPGSPVSQPAGSLLSLDLNVLWMVKTRPVLEDGFVYFLFFLKKAPKLYGFKEAPEKHKFISVQVVKQELGSRDLALPWDRLSAAPGQGVKAILSRGRVLHAGIQVMAALAP